MVDVVLNDKKFLTCNDESVTMLLTGGIKCEKNFSHANLYLRSKVRRLRERHGYCYGKDSDIKFKSKSYCEGEGGGSVVKTRCVYVNRNRHVFESDFTYQGIPFAVTLPKVPDAINADSMTTAQLHEKLRKGYDDIKAGKVQDTAEAFAKIRETQ